MRIASRLFGGLSSIDDAVNGENELTASQALRRLANVQFLQVSA